MWMLEQLWEIHMEVPPQISVWYIIHNGHPHIFQRVKVKTKKSPVVIPLASVSSGMVSAVSLQELEDSARWHMASELLLT